MGPTRYARLKFLWDKGGREKERRLQLAGGSTDLVTRTWYDSVGRTDSTTTRYATTDHYLAKGLSYRLDDHLTGFTATQPGITTGSQSFAYTADGLSRLRVGTTGGFSRQAKFDALGNVVEETTNQTVGTPECPGTRLLKYGPGTGVVGTRDNRLQERGAVIGGSGSCGIASTYYTDQAGQRIGSRDPLAAGYTGLQSLTTYTAAGQLYFALTPSIAPNWNYSWTWYDGAGRRVMSKTATTNTAPGGGIPHPDAVGGYRTMYVYDGSDVAMELEDLGGSSWRVVRRPLSIGLDRVAAGRFYLPGQGTKTVALVTDRMGTPVKALDKLGASVAGTWMNTDAWGTIVGAAATLDASSSGTGYTGAGRQTAAGGFIYLRNRWYDPTTGRFLTQDPIGLAGGVNLYEYAGSNPVSFDDPFGLDPCYQRATVRKLKCGTTILPPRLRT